MRVDTQFSIFLINKPGVLSEVTAALAKAGVNIIALSLSDSGEHGVLRLLPDNVEAARAVLAKEHDRWTEIEVLVTQLQNTPGAFATTAKTLADHHGIITYAYCTISPGTNGTTAVFKLADVNKALKILSDLDVD
ncbi:MAG TPA: ACT domain-containing protein [Phycisphaerae bacterium]|nr:ACT domain-containing protein [Phycisphaerae bacterium]